MLKSDLLQKLFDNWPAKILSLATALFLFLLIQSVSVSQRSFSVPLDVVVGESYEVQSTIPASVRVTLTGPEEQIYRILPEQISASVDFSDIAAEGTHLRKVGLSVDIENREDGLVTYVANPGEVKLYLAERQPGEGGRQ